MLPWGRSRPSWVEEAKAIQAFTKLPGQKALQFGIITATLTLVPAHRLPRKVSSLSPSHQDPSGDRSL